MALSAPAWRKRARAARRERRLRQPVIRFKMRVEDVLSGLRPDPPKDPPPDKQAAAVGHQSDPEQRYPGR